MVEKEASKICSHYGHDKANCYQGQTSMVEKGASKILVGEDEGDEEDGLPTYVDTATIVAEGAKPMKQQHTVVQQETGQKSKNPVHHQRAQV